MICYNEFVWLNSFQPIFMDRFRSLHLLSLRYIVFSLQVHAQPFADVSVDVCQCVHRGFSDFFGRIREQFYDTWNHARQDHFVRAVPVKGDIGAINESNLFVVAEEFATLLSSTHEASLSFSVVV